LRLAVFSMAGNFAMRFERWRRVGSVAKAHRQTLWLASAGLVLVTISSLPLDPNPSVSRAMGAAAAMALLWVTEPIPVPVTALLPLVFFPALGIMSGRQTAVCYMSDTHFVFIGSFFLANAVEKVLLHRRIALTLMGVLGMKPFWLLFGFCVASFLLSTCLSNTATAVMMIPLAFAVLDRVEASQTETAAASTPLPDEPRREHAQPQGACTGAKGVGQAGGMVSVAGAHDAGADVEVGPITSQSLGTVETVHAHRANAEQDGAGHEGDMQLLRKGVALGVAYSANLGGCCTLTGMPNP